MIQYKLGFGPAEQLTGGSALEPHSGPARCRRRRHIPNDIFDTSVIAQCPLRSRRGSGRWDSAKVQFCLVRNSRLRVIVVDQGSLDGGTKRKRFKAQMFVIIGLLISECESTHKSEARCVSSHTLLFHDLEWAWRSTARSHLIIIIESDESEQETAWRPELLWSIYFACLWHACSTLFHCFWVSVQKACVKFY